MAKFKDADLERLYQDSISADSEMYTECRSNILLVAGEHYTKRLKQMNARIREDSKDSEQKIRLTKNHTQRVIKLYTNNLISMSPGVQILPDNDKEQQSIKSASLHDSVWQHAKRKYDLKKKDREWIGDFFTLGECAAEVIFDPTKGKQIGVEPLKDDNGEVVLDEQTQQPLPSEIPVFSGDFVFKRHFAFNIFRPKDNQSLDDAAWLGIRDLVSQDAAIAVWGQDADKKKIIEGASRDSFVVFDASTVSYGVDEHDILLKKIYIRPCPDYPKGYFFIFTSAGKLDEGELPAGVFPLIIETCEEYQTSPRGRSPIKHGRPYQAEINRSASKMAEHQITLGDDKLVMFNNSKITQGANLPGIRTMHTNGPAPVIIQGRSGDQFLGYNNQQIAEYYQIMMLEEDAAPKQDGNPDPYALLYKSLKQRKYFSMYGEKFGRFQRKVCETFLELARYYFSEEELIPMIGRQEFVNISEYKNAKPIGFQIKVEEANDDLDTSMGKQLAYNHILQFVGPQLSRDDLGKLISNMPMLNAGETFSDFTMDYENATNDILALDRGQIPQPAPGQKLEYTLAKITSRMKKADFRTMLPPQVQQAYQMYQNQLQQGIAKQQADLRAANADLIPAQGFLTKCDFYVPDPSSPGKTRRAELPMDSLAWLVKRLEAQGSSLQQLSALPPTAQAAIGHQAQAINAGIGAQGSFSQPQMQPGQPHP